MLRGWHRPRPEVSAQVDRWMETLASLEPQPAPEEPGTHEVLGDVLELQQLIVDELGDTQKAVQAQASRLDSIEGALRASGGMQARGQARRKPAVAKLAAQRAAAKPRSGTVKWFNAEKGVGLIAVDDLKTDVFVHYSAIATSGYRSLEEDQKVEFEIKQGPKGPQADNIRPL